MDIDYANVFALTVYGKIGIKVWICKGEILGKRDLNPNFIEVPKKVVRTGDHREPTDLKEKTEVETGAVEMIEEVVR